MLGGRRNPETAVVMDRIPPTAVIAEKTYLEPGFNADGLDAAQLRSILNRHGCKYPISCPKAQLVRLFNEEIGVAQRRPGHEPRHVDTLDTVRLTIRTFAAR